MRLLASLARGVPVTGVRPEAAGAPRRAAAAPRCQATQPPASAPSPPPRRPSPLGSPRARHAAARAAALKARRGIAAARLSDDEMEALWAEETPGRRRSAFRSLLAASAQASADVEAYETWTGRLAMTLFFIELSFEEVSGGSSLFARVDLSTAQSCLSACAAACLLGAVCAAALLPLAKQHLASASRGALSRALTTSILLVSDDDRPGTLRSVADDLYARALDSALDDALRVLRAAAAAGEADAPPESRLAPVLARPASPAASNALLRAVLSDEDGTAS